MRVAVGALTALALIGCEAAINSGRYPEVRIINSTVSEVVVTVEGGGAQLRTTIGPQQSTVTGTGTSSAGSAVSFHVCPSSSGPSPLECLVDGEKADIVCHVLASAIGNLSNVPTITISAQPLQMACTSGWVESEG